MVLNELREVCFRNELNDNWSLAPNAKPSNRHSKQKRTGRASNFDPDASDDVFGPEVVIRITWNQRVDQRSLT